MLSHLSHLLRKHQDTTSQNKKLLTRNTPHILHMSCWFLWTELGKLPSSCHLDLHFQTACYPHLLNFWSWLSYSFLSFSVQKARLASLISNPGMHTDFKWIWKRADFYPFCVWQLLLVHLSADNIILFILEGKEAPPCYDYSRY